MEPPGKFPLEVLFVAYNMLKKVASSRWSEIRMRQDRDDDHREDPPHFMI